MSTKNENVVDDWECIDDSELNTKVNQIKKNATNNQSISNAEIECSRPFAAMLLNDDDCMRTQYVPPEPTVKILKRPTNDKNNQQLLAEQRPKAPIKTLQQREQEYAEARLRILGSARSEEEEQEEVVQPPSVVEKNGTPSLNNVNGYSNRNVVSNSTRAQFARNSQHQQYSSYQQHQPPPPIHNQQPPSFQIPPDMRRLEDNVIIRLPRGPDGSSGFMLKR